MEPATTEIYTYGHHLPLHAALPICRARRRADRGEVGELEGRVRRRLQPHQRRVLARGDDRLGVGDVDQLRAHPAPALRSEEHTSELQSLMRISYAVFCLKNKQNNEPYSYRTLSNNMLTHP